MPSPNILSLLMVPFQGEFVSISTWQSRTNFYTIYPIYMQMSTFMTMTGVCIVRYEIGSSSVAKLFCNYT